MANWRRSLSFLSLIKTIFLLISAPMIARTGQTESSGPAIAPSVSAPVDSATPSVSSNYSQVEDLLCPDNLPCDKLSGDCLNCDFTAECMYGVDITTICRPKPGLVCTGNQNMTKHLKCRYCYQTEPSEHVCTNTTNCKVITAPRQRYTANCTVKHDVLCLGHRKFYKRLLCNWTSGYRWSTALVLSMTLGGLGADRFYLGLWREGIGKLFSFGGLGVWTLVDVILIAIGYVGPADDSLYIY